MVHCAMLSDKFVIIGSYAAHFHIPEYRLPQDLDILVHPDNQHLIRDLYKNTFDRVEPAWYGPSSQWILDHTEGEYPSLDTLYTIKAAQLKFDVKWDKTSNDVIDFQKRGCQVIPELFDLLLQDFTAFHGRRWAKLEGKDNKTFFEDAVKRKYVHDSIHEAVAYYDRPLYESILTGKGVSCSRKKFESLSHDDQIRLAKEEIFVTALERFLIPQNFKFSSQRAYWLSLKKFVTTMSSGWMSKFLIDNFLELSYNKDQYTDKFNQNRHKLIENK